MRHDGWNWTLSLLALLFACQPRTGVLPSAEIDASRQLVMVVTSNWTSTTGTMTRFERATPTSVWNRVEAPIPLVVGRTGIAWGVGFDDTASAHYNTVVDRAAVSRVDWNSAEHMRQVAQYKIGVIVGYNASPPVKGRGSCIFLHIWAGPDSHTAGCTAFDEAKLREVMLWLDPNKRPLLVQLTGQEYQKLQSRWRLPALKMNDN